MHFRLKFSVSIQVFFFSGKGKATDSLVAPGGRSLAERSSVFLGALGALAFLGFADVSYIVYKASAMAADVALHTPPGAIDWRFCILLMVLLAPTWVCFTVMNRCQALLVERHFK